MSGYFVLSVLPTRTKLGSEVVDVTDLYTRETMELSARRRLQNVRRLDPERTFLEAVAVFGTYGMVYFGVAAALRLDEIHGVATRVRRLLGR